jgi:hypothetical protein
MPTCPADGFAVGTVCRGAAGPCDQVETCPGGTINCPADVCAPTAGGGSIGSIGVGGSTNRSGCIRPGEQVGFSVSFPSMRTTGGATFSGTPGGGTPSLSVNGGNMKLTGISGCGNSDNWSFTDNQSIAGVSQWSSHPTPWPSSMSFNVRNTGSSCSQANFNLSVSR